MAKILEVVTLPLEGSEDTELSGIIVPIPEDGAVDFREIMSGVVDEGFRLLPTGIIHLINMNNLGSQIGEDLLDSIELAVPIRCTKDWTHCLQRSKKGNWHQVPFNGRTRISGKCLMLIALPPEKTD